MISQDRRLRRLNEYELEFPNELGVPVRVLANPEIPLEKKAVDELADLLTLGHTIENLRRRRPDFLPAHAELSRVVLTPDFHKGAGIPIGTVMETRGFAVPQAVGNDVNCGMRLAATNINRERVIAHAEELEKALRHVFFEGGRNITLSPARREALLRFGLPGLLDSNAKREGLLQFADGRGEDSHRMHGGGGYPVDGIFALNDYVREGQASHHDALIGNIGGGNHFVELQYVKRIHDGGTAHDWGVRGDAVMVMIHSGSLGLGHLAGKHALDIMKSIWPAGESRPGNGILPLPRTERFAQQFARYRTSLRNAANFAFGNRLFLQLMVREAFEQVLGECDWRLIYDAPHNLMWEDESKFTHRKGATLAGGFTHMAGGPYAYRGEPVIVPGSMGSASFLLAGRGNDVGLCSACHGAGRVMPRGTAMRADDALLDAFLRDFRVITPVDIHRPDITGRRDIIKKWRESLKQEAPYAYKDITPVIDTLTAADVARPVAELWPLMTIKG